MNRKVVAIASLVIFAATLLSAPVPASKDGTIPGRCMMWKATSKTATVFLLGTLHVATPEMYPMPKAVEEAFAKSDRLVVEVNMNKLDQQKMFAFIAEKGGYKDGKTLPECVSKETWAATRDAIQQFGIPLTGFEKLKPWYVGMVLMMAQIEKLGYDAKLGIDQHFLDIAMKKRVGIDELETADFQMNIFANGDDKKQEQVLVSTLAEIKSMKDEIATLISAWIAGDAGAIDAVLSAKLADHPESREFVNELIYDRNAPMAAKIGNYLKGTGTVFVAVGSAHLVGTNGIVKMLRDQHFAVEQCSATTKTEGNKP